MVMVLFLHRYYRGILHRKIVETLKVILTGNSHCIKLIQERISALECRRQKL